MKSIKFLITIIILGSFLSCKSIENGITGKTPFKIEKATYNSWVGGVESVRGYKVEIQLETNYKLDSIYFRNMKGALELDVNNSKIIYTAIFTIQNKPQNLILHSDPKKEFGNQAPNLQKNIPFTLKNDEAVISFKTKKGTQYFKIENLEKTEAKLFP